jgi:hypothetical protein
MINLLNNAVQHGAARSPIVLDVAQEDDEVRMVVRNYGIPIPPEALQVIFNPLVKQNSIQRYRVSHGASPAVGNCRISNGLKARQGPSMVMVTIARRRSRLFPSSDLTAERRRGIAAEAATASDRPTRATGRAAAAGIAGARARIFG